MKVNLSESIVRNLNENEQKDINSIAKSIEGILRLCHAEVSYVDVWSEERNIIDLSCKVKADILSKYDNDVSIEGRIYLDENLNVVETDIKTASGPNILNYDFIKCLNALYGYISSGFNHYDV